MKRTSSCFLSQHFFALYFVAIASPSLTHTRSHAHRFAHHLARLVRFAQAEVDQNDHGIFVLAFEHDVLELQVAVAHVFAVQVAHRGANLVHVPRALLFGVRHAGVPYRGEWTEEVEGEGKIEEEEEEEEEEGEEEEGEGEGEGEEEGEEEEGEIDDELRKRK